jgi:hypothetical protein
VESWVRVLPSWWLTCVDGLEPTLFLPPDIKETWREYSRVSEF